MMDSSKRGPGGQTVATSSWTVLACAAVLAWHSTGCATQSRSRPSSAAAPAASVVVAGRTGKPQAPSARGRRESTPRTAASAAVGENENSRGDDRVILAGGEEESRSFPSPAGGRPRRIREFAERLQLPPDLPGAEFGQASLPTLDDPEARRQAIEDLFPPLPALPEHDPALDYAGRRYTLRELEELALTVAPGIEQAQQSIVGAEGAAWQVGRQPNPLFGYEADTVRTAGTAAYQGIFFEQNLRTAGKLKLAQEVAGYDVVNAELDFRKAQADQLNAVRKAWFNVLVARENVRITRVLAAFSESMFTLPVDQLRQEQIAPYEPLPLRALVVQARAAFEAAIARERAAWQQLAAAVGEPNLPEGELEGTAVVKLNSLHFPGLVTWLEAYHTDLQAACNLERQAQVQVEAQYRQRVPDLRIYSAVQEDYTTPPVRRTVYNLQVGFPVPIFDFNRGNIQKAQAGLVSASRQYERVRNDLRQKLAAAWQRFESARIQVLAYRQQVLPDQARAYLGFAQRHAEEGSVSYIDVVVAQQNLATALNVYLTSLSDQWDAWTDLLQILQVTEHEQAPGAEEIWPDSPPAEVPPIPRESAVTGGID